MDIQAQTNGQDMDVAALVAQIAAMQAAVAKLQADKDALAAKLVKANTRKLTLKVSEKGAVSLYGMGRFPVTLYREQWERMLNAREEILGFIEDNADRLSIKD